MFGKAVDAQILGISKHFPKYVHIIMVPDMANCAKADVDTDAQLSLRLFTGSLILNRGKKCVSNA